MDQDILDHLTELLGDEQEAIDGYDNFVQFLETENRKYLDTKYRDERRGLYPSASEQLDMIWHELNQTGKLTDSGDWFNSIRSVKDQYPKP